MTPPPGLSFGVGFALAIGLSQPSFVLQDAPSDPCDPSPSSSSSHHPSSERDSPSSAQSDPSNPTSPPPSEKAAASDAPTRVGVAHNNDQTKRNVRAFWHETRASEDEVSRVVFDSLFDSRGRVRVDWITSGEWLGAYASAEHELLEQAARIKEHTRFWREEDDAYHDQHDSDELASIGDDGPAYERDEDSEPASASASPCLPPTPNLFLEPRDPKRLFADILPTHAHTLQRKRRTSLDVFRDDEDGKVDTSGRLRSFFGINQRPFWLKAPPGDLNVTTKSPTSPVDKAKDTSAQFALLVQEGIATKAKKGTKGKGNAKRVRWAQADSASPADDGLAADSEELEDAGLPFQEAEVSTSRRTGRIRKRTKRR